MLRLEATADIWLSDANEKERNSSSGKADRFKLKSIQEMAAIRFETDPIKGRKIISARLFLHPTSTNNRLRYIRVSSINQDWTEGNSRRHYGSGNGATYNFADHDSQKPWAWKGSQFCDVTFSSGHSLTGYAEIQKEDNGWISVDVDPEIVTAMAIGDSDGMAVMEGGTLEPYNNFVHSRESGRLAPYLLVKVGPPFNVVPEKPVIDIRPDQDHTTQTTGAVLIRIKNDPNAFCWLVKANGKTLQRWQVPHPRQTKFTEFTISNLSPSASVDVEMAAISSSGHLSQETKVSGITSSVPFENIPFGKITPLFEKGKTSKTNNIMRVWAFPGLVKISPLDAKPLHADVGWVLPIHGANAVWDGLTVSLFGIRGEYVDFQICVEALKGNLENLSVSADPMHGPKNAILKKSDIEIYQNWYAKTKSGIWQPAYTIPIKPDSKFRIPDPERGIPNQQNQTFYIDVYIPKNATAGTYTGRINISAEGKEIQIPVQLEVHDFLMPDRLVFWPEMNAYHIPENYMAYYRLAHQHRCVPNFWAFRPRIIKDGDRIKIDWNEYDKRVGPLLSGEAFAGDRRSGIPVECLYLPFMDSWPTPLTPKTYHYTGYWPKRGDDSRHLIDHYMQSPPIAEAMSREYKENFLAVQKQFIEHFKKKGWDHTEFQCFFGGKKTHRINYGSNIWWTTDEPYHWEDWTALQFFSGLWTHGRKRMKASANTWAYRADISRPQWQGRVLENRLNVGYYGGFDDDRTFQRCKILKEETKIKVRAYGAAPSPGRSNMETVALVLNTWLNGADGFQTWWATGRKKSLDIQEGCPGNALFAPGDRFDLPVVGDMRLKAFRKGEQLIEYLVMLENKYNLNSQRIKNLIYSTKIKKPDDENAAIQLNLYKAWQIDSCRKNILKFLEKDHSQHYRGLS